MSGGLARCVYSILWRRCKFYSWIHPWRPFRLLAARCSSAVMNREKSPRRDPSMRPLFRGVMNPCRPGRRYAKCNSCFADSLTNVYDKLRNPPSLDRGRSGARIPKRCARARNCIVPSPSFNDSPNDQTCNNRIDCVAKCGRQRATRRDATRRVMRMKRHRERKGPADVAFMCLAIYERVARPLLKASP